VKRQHEGIRQRKALGQVFLNTDWPCQRVLEEITSWGAGDVLEIGPGGGVLTFSLLAGGIDVLAIEMDERFAYALGLEYQRRQQPEWGKLEVIAQDFLRFNLDEWLSKQTRRSALVGNIPYRISTPILINALNYLPRLHGVVLLVQKEFAERIVGRQGSKDYGSISVYTQLRADAKIVANVGRECFTPSPKVDSALMVLTARAQVLSPEVLKKTELVTRLAFQQRRKKLHNAVKSLLQERSPGDSPIDLNLRADAITAEDFVTLTKFIFPQIQ